MSNSNTDILKSRKHVAGGKLKLKGSVDKKFRVKKDKVTSEFANNTSSTTGVESNQKNKAVEYLTEAEKRHRQKRFENTYFLLLCNLSSTHRPFIKTYICLKTYLITILV